MVYTQEDRAAITACCDHKQMRALAKRLGKSYNAIRLQNRRLRIEAGLPQAQRAFRKVYTLEQDAQLLFSESASERAALARRWGKSRQTVTMRWGSLRREQSCA